MAGHWQGWRQLIIETSIASILCSRSIAPAMFSSYNAHAVHRSCQSFVMAYRMLGIRWVLTCWDRAKPYCNALLKSDKSILVDPRSKISWRSCPEILDRVCWTQESLDILDLEPLTWLEASDFSLIGRRHLPDLRHTCVFDSSVRQNAVRGLGTAGLHMPPLLYSP